MGSVVVTRDSVTGSRCSDGIGMLKTSLQAGESFNVAVVFFLEVGLEVGHGVLHCGFILPFVYGTVKDAGFDKHSECETNGCGISDGFPAGSSKHLTVVDVLPKVFDRFLRHPWSGEMLMVGIEIYWRVSLAGRRKFHPWIVLRFDSSKQPVAPWSTRLGDGWLRHLLCISVPLSRLAF